MQKLTFGTDGIRGRVGQFPFTPTALQFFCSSLGHWMFERYASAHGRVKVLLAGDTRESVDAIKKIFIDQCDYFPIDIVDAGVIPTPAVLTLIQKDSSFACGVMISASHNPYYDNGIKLFDAVSCKIAPADEKRICTLFDAYASGQIALPAGQPLGSCIQWPAASDAYVHAVTSLLPVQIGQSRRVVLDCANGATYRVAPAIFKALGAQVIVLHDAPNGMNINDHAGALHPERLQAAVIEHGADVGFAFDGDGDRIMAVSARGEAKDGDDVLAALLDLPEYAQEPVVVGTIMSNSGLDAYLKARGKAFVRTPVGDKHILAKLDELSVILGGEPSGHIILKNYLGSGDGILVAAKMLQALQLGSNWLLDHVTKFPQLTVSIPVHAKPDLHEEPYAAVLRLYDKKIDNGKILVRYSGTEPVLRIMVEGESALVIQEIAQQLALDLQKLLND